MPKCCWNSLFRRAAGRWGLHLALAVSCQCISGCKGKPAAAVELVHEPGETEWRRTLDSEAERSLVTGFASLASGRSPHSSPQVAPGGRWSDVPLAAVYACDDIEAAITRRIERDWGWEYRVRTVEDWPGMLIIRRAEGVKPYSATASIGHFEDRSDRARTLLEAFDRRMLEFAQKPRFPE